MACPVWLQACKCQWCCLGLRTVEAQLQSCQSAGFKCQPCLDHSQPFDRRCQAEVVLGLQYLPAHMGSKCTSRTCSAWSKCVKITAKLMRNMRAAGEPQRTDLLLHLLIWYKHADEVGRCRAKQQAANCGRAHFKQACSSASSKPSSAACRPHAGGGNGPHQYAQSFAAGPAHTVIWHTAKNGV